MERGCKTQNQRLSHKHLKEKHSQSWLKAVNYEMNPMMKNYSWQLVRLSKKQRMFGCKWIFKKNEGILRVEESTFKTELAEKGFTHVGGIYYNETFSPMVKHCSIMVLLDNVN